MSDHRWAAVAITDLSSQQAEELAGLHMLERLERICELFGPRDEAHLSDVWAVRGPICADCRVSWEDVHRHSKPWPCPGRKPDTLGGTLLNPTASRPAENRAQRRAKHRQSVKTKPGSLREIVEGQVQASIIKARSEREQRRRVNERAAEPLTKLAEVLAGADDLEGYLA